VAWALAATGPELIDGLRGSHPRVRISRLGPGEEETDRRFVCGQCGGRTSGGRSPPPTAPGVSSGNLVLSQGPATADEIATVVREIRELLTTPCTDRDEPWHNRRTALEARNAALVDECQDIAAMRPRWQHEPQPADAHPANPAVAPEVQR
jgi:hypothetical protein